MVGRGVVTHPRMGQVGACGVGVRIHVAVLMRVVSAGSVTPRMSSDHQDQGKNS